MAADGFVTTVLGTAGSDGILTGPLPGGLSRPTDVNFDGSGNLYVGSSEAIVKVSFGH